MVSSRGSCEAAIPYSAATPVFRALSCPQRSVICHRQKLRGDEKAFEKQCIRATDCALYACSSPMDLHEGSEQTLRQEAKEKARCRRQTGNPCVEPSLSSTEIAQRRKRCCFPRNSTCKFRAKLVANQESTSKFLKTHYAKLFSAKSRTRAMKEDVQLLRSK